MKISVASTEVNTAIQSELSRIENVFLSDTAKTNLTNVYNDVRHKYAVLQCNFIGDWDTIDECSDVIPTMFCSVLERYLPGIEDILGETLYQYTSTDFTSERKRTDDLTHNGMHELSPITSDLGSINTPDSKYITEDSGTVTYNDTNKDPEYKTSAVDAMLNLRNIFMIVDKCFRTVIDEYNRFY